MKKLFIIGAVCICATAYAHEKPACHDPIGMYATAECGASIAAKTMFGPNWCCMGLTEHSWVPTASDSFETKLGTHKYMGLRVGYQCTDTIAIEGLYGYRGPFGSVRGYAPTTNAPHGEIYAISCVKSQTILFGVRLAPKVDWSGFVPYVSSALGVAVNKTNCVCNYDVFNQTNAMTFNTCLNGCKCHHFAWQIGIGADCTFLKHWQLGLGYRYVDIGLLTTTNRFADALTHHQGTILPFVACHPCFNEVFFCLAVHF